MNASYGYQWAARSKERSPRQIEAAAVEQFTRDAADFATAPIATDEAALAVIGELAGAGPGDRVIDVACGPGVVAAHLARNGAHVTGVDLTPKMLELARERAAASGCSQLTSFVEGRMEALDFGAASFTVAVSRYALHHAADPSAVVAELCRVVEPGGRVVVVDFAAPDDPVAAGAYDEAERRRDPSHVRNLTRSEQRALFVTRGWEVESESGYRMPARLEAVLARSHGPDHDGVRRAFEASLDNHRLGVDARRTGNGIVFDYPIAAWAFTRRSERRS